MQRPCWNKAEFLHILKPDAEEILDEVFHAVHCETDLQIADTADGPRVHASPHTLVERFLDPTSNYVQAVVLGESGTGKSHLIQWLRLNIPKSEDTVMLTIPRTKTSLRGVVQRIIDELPLEQREPYLQRLAQGGTQAMSQKAKAEKFLSALAHAIRHSGLVDDEDRELADLLPNVLLDPNFREKFFLKPNGVIAMILKHVFDDPDARDIDERRREFSTDDLPLDGVHYQLASFPAQEAIDFITFDAGMPTRAIALMNMHRDLAIAQTLNFSADQLIDLMNALRRHLAVQGKKLILLIEDFARVQGIDTALLQALVTPPNQGNEQLCELRWAMAVTTGPFKRLEATVRTRATIVVDMDASKPASLAQLTAGYLNALRLGAAALSNLPLTEPSPSHCVGCAVQTPCWEAFGSVDGVGLFPFTEASIDIMALRTESLDDSGAFNARNYMRRVLQGVLKLHYSELEQGEFPSTAVLERIGGPSRLSPMERRQLENREGAHTAARRIALLELYDGQGRIVNLNAGIHEAFVLPALSSVEEAPVEELQPLKNPIKPVVTEHLPPHVEVVRRWVDKGDLPQSTVNELRQLVFASLENFIDWDSLGMAKTAVASPSSSAKTVFQQRSINFSRQQGQRFEQGVVLDITEEHAVALEALLTHKFLSNWDFPKGSLLMAYLLESMRQWADSVTRQLRELYRVRAGWDPLVATAELLTIAAYLSGRVRVEHKTDNLVAKMWELSGTGQVHASDPKLGKLGDDLQKAVPKLVSFLRNHASGTKGGQARNFVRPWPVLHAVRALRQGSLKLSLTPPRDKQVTELADIVNLYQRVQDELPDAIAAERARRKRWLLEVSESIGDKASMSELVAALRETAEQVSRGGISCGNSRALLVNTMTDLKLTALDSTLSHARALEKASAADLLSRIAAMADYPDTIGVLVARGVAFVEAAEIGLANERARLEAQSGAGLIDSETRIEDALGSITRTLSMLSELQGGIHEPA